MTYSAPIRKIIVLVALPFGCCLIAQYQYSNLKESTEGSLFFFSTGRSGQLTCTLTTLFLYPVKSMSSASRLRNSREITILWASLKNRIVINCTGSQPNQILGVGLSPFMRTTHKKEDPPPFSPKTTLFWLQSNHRRRGNISIETETKAS